MLYSILSVHKWFEKLSDLHVEYRQIFYKILKIQND